MGELPCTEKEGFTGADPDPPSYASKKKKQQGESNHDSNGKLHSFNDLDMIQGTGEERSEQPTVSMKNSSNPRCSQMKMKQTLKLSYLNEFKKRANECETPADEIPFSFSSPTAAAQNVSIFIAPCTQSSHGYTANKHQGKRGRPRKLEVKEPQAPPAQGNQFENATPIIIGRPRNLEVKEPQAPPAQGDQLENATAIIVGLESSPLVRSSWTKKPRGSSGIKVRRSNKGTLSGEKRKRGRPRKALVITRATPGAAGESFHDAPLSILFEEMKSPAAGSNLEEQHGDKSVQDPAIGEVVIASNDSQGLPFVKKNTLVWDTIQSMGVFQKTPQNPHFRPLKQIKDGHREGLAIGYMVTFASVAERTCRLTIHDSRSTIEQLLETLGDLEPHGFDVEPMCGYLNKMLSFSQKNEQLQGLLSKTSSEMEKHTVEKAQIHEEVDGLKRKIAELEERLSHAMSKKEAKKDDIGSVQCSMDGIREEIRHLCKEYQALMSKPF